VIGFVGGQEVGRFDWQLAATVGTAFGTTALAYVTWSLAKSATEQARDSRRLVELTQVQHDARYTPCVFPQLTPEWFTPPGVPQYEILIVNSGEGVAVNVEGQIHWQASGAANTPLVRGDAQRRRERLGAYSRG
jgi:hypothetical protein